MEEDEPSGMGWGRGKRMRLEVGRLARKPAPRSGHLKLAAL
jgi:hypothetical protein